MLSYLVCFWVTLFCLFLGERHKASPLVVFALVILILFSGFRYGVGIDYMAYWDIYRGIESSQTEWGFRLICWLFFKMGFGPQVIFLFSSWVFVYSVSKGVFYYDKKNILFVFFVFMFSGIYLESLNLVRQYIAIGLFFWGTKYIVEQALWKYIAVVIFASLFHSSALILLPFYWLLAVKYKPFTLMVILFLSIGISCFFPLKTLLGLIPYYGDYLTIYSDLNPVAELGLGYFTKIVLASLAVLFYPLLLSDTPHKYVIVMNAFVFYVALMTIFRDYMVFLRISYYFHIFIILLLPRFLLVVTKRSRPVIYILAIFYCCFLFVSILNTSDTYYLPYLFNFDLYTFIPPSR